MTDFNTNGPSPSKGLDMGGKDDNIPANPPIDRKMNHPATTIGQSEAIDSKKRKTEDYDLTEEEEGEDIPLVALKKPKLSNKALLSSNGSSETGPSQAKPRLSDSRTNQVDTLVRAIWAKKNEADSKKTIAKSETNKKSPKTLDSSSSKDVKEDIDDAMDVDDQESSTFSSGKLANSEIISQYIELTRLPFKVKPLTALSNNEKKELERYLEMTKDDTWQEDWIGNLAFADKDVYNPDGKARDRQKKSLFRWAERGKVSLKLLNNLLRVVHNLKETPAQAKKILSSADPTSVRSIQDTVRRVSYDPVVLQQDGWTTAKSLAPIGASGGPHRIGEMVHWQGYEGVVIAYIHDHDLGDLWKAMWLEEFDTFDLEVEEVDDAKKRYSRKQKQKEQAAVGVGQQKKDSASASSSTSADVTRRSGRYASADFQVSGIEHGIVMAVSYSRGSRPGVYWPARIMHFSEMQSYGSQNKRVTTKQKVDVVFLAPYWNAPTNLSSGRRTESYSDSLARHGSSIFDSGPLFEIENIDASQESIQDYPYNTEDGLDLDQLRDSFKFAGLPKAAFSRFVDSHRLALGLKTYSEKVMKSTAASDLDRTTAGLFEAHPIAGQTAHFPSALLHLPFQFILAQLPDPEKDNSSGSYSDSKSIEPVLQLGVILESMKPPTCWGMGESATIQVKSSPDTTPHSKPLFASPPISLQFGSNSAPVTLDHFLHGLSALSSLLSKTDDESSMSNLLAQNLSQLLSKVPSDASEFQNLSTEDKRERLKSLVKLWIVVKTHGEELISSCKQSGSFTCLEDWRRACERIYKYITIAFTSDGFGNGTSWVITDSVCSLHLTSNECFERSVRLPAALKGAREAGAGKSHRLKLMIAVKEKYLEMAEKEVVRRAHSKSYLQRMKKKCMSVTQEGEVVSLTEDSDGNGGHDTMGSKGSWKAAIAAVGAAVQAVDMIMNGECVNVFCTTRPPGHHAGRELHPMKAVSNGFCLLNAAACAALYATAPVSEGGAGLRRVCVIDIDVHHGNGTQDILCSTYDPRFFYVSIHAGGADVNGVDPGDDADQLSHHLGRNRKKGIFPGRCGDTSPHQGVLNIPLGGRVTSHALGAALVTKVTPAVEKFSPELIIVSAGFDAHKNDPLGLGGLCAEDFGTLTEVICKLAHKSCSGRVLSILEGGYGIPCCRQQISLFDPEAVKKRAAESAQTQNKEGSKEETKEESKPLSNGSNGAVSDVSSALLAKQEQAQRQLEILDLGEEMPAEMKDEMSYPLQRRLDKCHAEGFIQCVREHVKTLAKCNMRN